MPSPALPIPINPTNRVRLFRIYTDLSGRPLSGRVTVTGTTHTRTGDAVVLASPTVIDLVDGTLSVMLPPDTYDLTADLLSVDRVESTHLETVTLGGTE